jgi:hypothetical protein
MNRTRFMLRDPAHWVAYGFGSGLAPKAPGTVGTLWGWVSFLALDPWLGDAGWAMVIVAALIVGQWACTRTARHLAAGKRLGQAFGRGIGTGFDRDGLQGGGGLVLRGCGRTQGPERQSDRNRSQGEGRRVHEPKYY